MVHTEEERTEAKVREVGERRNPKESMDGNSAFFLQYDTFNEEI